MRVAMKISTAASVASGTSLSSPAAGISTISAAAAARPAACVRPPAEAAAAVRARAGVDREGSEQARPRCCRRRRRRSRGRRRPRSGPASAKARVVAADWLTTTSATTPAIGATLPIVDHERSKRPSRGAPWRDRRRGSRRRARAARAAATSDGRADETDERARQLAVDPLGADDDGEDDRRRSPSVQPLVSPRCDSDGRDPVERRAARPREAEQVGQLVHDDDHRHAGEEAGDDRRREELGDPAEPQQPDQRDDHPDDHREDRRPGRRSGASRPARGARSPTAKSGAIVESAPTDICGFEPSSANSTVPATKA